MISFFFFLLLPRWLLLYTSCVHGAPYAFNDILINDIYRFCFFLLIMELCYNISINVGMIPRYHHEKQVMSLQMFKVFPVLIYQILTYMLHM
jgi:hypothetical protein